MLPRRPTAQHHWLALSCSEMAAIDALIFDLDGTLVDTLADITASARHAIAPITSRAIAQGDVEPWVSHGAQALLTHLTGIADSERVAALVARFREHYRAHGLDASKLFAGWSDVLDHLAALGVPMCVLSNKPDPSTQWICGALLARWPFRAIVGLRDGVPAKPDPAGVRGLIATLGVEPRFVALVGDSPLDMQAASAAGCRALGVGWGFHTTAELRAAGAERVLGSPSELSELFEKK